LEKTKRTPAGVRFSLERKKKKGAPVGTPNDMWLLFACTSEQTRQNGAYK
jgi:hypothetical protein